MVSKMDIASLADVAAGVEDVTAIEQYQMQDFSKNIVIICLLCLVCLGCLFSSSMIM